MRKLPIHVLEPGMILGKTIIAANGFVLLQEGSELTPSYIKRLQTMGYPSVMVKENFTDGLSFPEIVSEKLRGDGSRILGEVFAAGQKSRKIDTKRLKDLVNLLVDEVQQNRQSLYETSDIRPNDSYLYRHSVNVCVLALRLGFQLKYNELQLRDLGIGAMLHDIGLIFIDNQLAQKQAQLTPADLEKVKGHSMLGFNLVREHKDVNLLAAHVSLQHHERVDGTGYPRSLKGTDICEFARIVTIADMFDALTSERAHRPVYSFSRAVQILTEKAGSKLDARLVDLFLKNIAVYAVGSLVEINSGDIGLVVQNNYQHPRKPVVRLVKESCSPIVDLTGPEVNLADYPELFINRLVEDDRELVDKLRQVSDEQRKVV